MKLTSAKEAWGGPFDGRTISPEFGSDLRVYQGKNTGMTCLGIPFEGGSIIGAYVHDPRVSKLVWRSA